MLYGIPFKHINYLPVEKNVIYTIFLIFFYLITSTYQLSNINWAAVMACFFQSNKGGFLKKKGKN